MRRIIEARARAMRMAFAGVLLCGVFACAPAVSAPANVPPVSATTVSDAVITLERHPCFGTCPVYTVRIAGDGTVDFNGTRHVVTVGHATAAIPTADVAALLEAFGRVKFNGMAAKYLLGEPSCMGPFMTDAPTVITTLTVGGQTKRVEHDHGCLAAPATLTELERMVDSTARVARWIK